MVDFTGGCGGAARGRVSALGAGGEERQRRSERASAPAWAGIGGRVGAGAGRLRRAAASTAHGRHAAGKLCRGRAWRGASAAGARGGRLARRWAGLGRGEARGAAGCWLGRLRPWARSEAAAREGGKSLFHLYFQGIFKCHLSNIILSKKMTSFENVPKMKVA